MHQYLVLSIHIFERMRKLQARMTKS